MIDSSPTPITFETSPSDYRHWKLRVEGERADLTLDVDRFGGLNTAIELKGNSYDLSVDIELADVVQRLRLEHPEVRVVVIGSADERIFCSGANIHTLAGATHTHKVNFCKFTNETRLYIEEASAQAGQRYIAACGGATAGGGYELALACDEILLVDDGSSALSLPEIPLLAVLPGTGGLTRLVDKRKVRPDLVDLFATMAEGVRGKRVLEWGLADAIAPRSRFQVVIDEHVAALAARDSAVAAGAGITLEPLEPRVSSDEMVYRYVQVQLDHAARVASIQITGPDSTQPQSSGDARSAGSIWWPIRMARELDDAILRLRFNFPMIGLLLLRTRGDLAEAHACGELLAQNDDAWIVKEARYLLGRVMRRFDLMSRTTFSIVDEGSCFAGPLFELLLASDRSYVLESDAPMARPGSLSGALLPRWNGETRLTMRFLGAPESVQAVLDAGRDGDLTSDDLQHLGLATECFDDLDFDDSLRLAIEERASLSPDALIGLEASTRFGGPETMATKIFGRLSAWQNWIFTRPNSTGESGALTLYGKPERPKFDFTRA